ncbi:MAG: glycosyltransferase family 39 protein [Magnetococcales bacterium]|nr:glycosyltransferase family 39 protein [Magnetococcales bacterium]
MSNRAENRPDHSAGEEGDRQAVWVLIAIICVAAVVRFVLLDAAPYWKDERFTVNLTQMDVASILGWGDKNDVHPPLYYLTVHYWIQIFGTSPMAFRSVSALLGTILIIPAWMVGRRLFGTVPAHGMALMVAIVPFHVHHAQDARMYPLFLLCSLLALLAFLRLRDGVAGMGWKSVHVLAIVASLYTHNYAVFLPVVLNLYMVGLWWMKRRDPRIQRLFRTWILLQVAIGLLYLPWITVMLKQVSDIQGNYWIERESLFRYIFGSLAIYSGTLKYIMTPLVAVGMILLCLPGVLKSALLHGEKGEDGVLRRILMVPVRVLDPGRWQRSEEMVLVLMVFLLPLLIPAIVSQFIQPMFLPRGAILSSLFFYLIAARGVTLLPGRVGVMVGGGVVLASLINLGDYYLHQIPG